MKVRLVSREGKTATVRVTPSWLARVFGAQPYLLRCVRRETNYGPQWVTEATQRVVSSDVLDALDREGLAELPKASVEHRTINKL